MTIQLWLVLILTETGFDLFLMILKVNDHPYLLDTYPQEQTNKEYKGQFLHRYKDTKNSNGLLLIFS